MYFEMRELLLKEISYSTSRSSGPGGQHVNKTESKVTLCWNLEKSIVFTEDQKELLHLRLRSRLTGEGDLLMSSESSRSQAANKEDVTERFLSLIEASLRPVKKRIKTKPSSAAVEKRLKEKKARGERKRSRGRPEQD